MHQLFVTQVYQKKVSVNLADLRQEIIRISEVDKEGIKWSAQHYVQGFTSYGSWDQLHKMSSTFMDLQKKLDLHVNAYAKQLDYELPKGSLKMDTCWVNIMPSGAQHTGHIHPHSVISGTFYVDTPPHSSAIKFEDPRLHNFMNAPVVQAKAKKENQRFFSLNPKAGDVVLFESWLRHEVPRNFSKKPRISVSFNYGWN